MRNRILTDAMYVVKRFVVSAPAVAEGALSQPLLLAAVASATWPSQEVLRLGPPQTQRALTALASLAWPSRETLRCETPHAFRQWTARGQARRS